jgi:hypothetical protein
MSWEPFKRSLGRSAEARPTLGRGRRRLSGLLAAVAGLEKWRRGPESALGNSARQRSHAASRSSFSTSPRLSAPASASRSFIRGSVHVERSARISAACADREGELERMRVGPVGRPSRDWSMFTARPEATRHVTVFAAAHFSWPRQFGLRPASKQILRTGKRGRARWAAGVDCRTSSARSRTSRI